MVKRAQVPAMEEFDFTTSKISSNFSNFSSWHYRSKLLPVIHPDPAQPLGIAKDVMQSGQFHAGLSLVSVRFRSFAFEFLWQLLSVYISTFNHYVWLHAAVYSCTFRRGWMGRGCLYSIDMSVFWCNYVVLAYENLHVYTVRIWHCEHARFSVEVFMHHI